ncbi:TPA: Lar family restriction alleviation protein [Serratia marcescens]|nr:Lar family restriction alleviation protein [Serratia marcescens]
MKERPVMPANELKPCPFCQDGKPEIDGDFYGDYFIRCTCGARGAKSDEPCEAQDLWNRRVGDSAREIVDGRD